MICPFMVKEKLLNHLTKNIEGGSMASYKDIIEKRKKDWNCETLLDADSVGGEKISFSSPLMNYATYGGIPKYAITEFFGEPGAGKSTTAIDICKNAIEMFKVDYTNKLCKIQEKIDAGNKSAKSELEDLEDNGPQRVLYLDLEHSFDRAWSDTLGINREEIDIMQPPNISAEEILQMVKEIVETSEVGLIVLDSIPSLVPQTKLDKKVGERTVAPLAGLMSDFIPRIVPMLHRYHVTLLMINQIRDNLNNPYVVATPGGEAIKFYSSLRILFKIGKPVDFLGNELNMGAENPDGYIVGAKIVKQKTAPFDRKNASYYLMCKSGIRVDMDYAQLAINKYGIIKKTGGWYSMCDPITGEVLEDEEGKLVKVNGMLKVYEYLESNPKYFDKLKAFIVADIDGNGIEEESISEDML